MNILNIICYFSLSVLACVLFLFLFATFGISIYSYFPKKNKEKDNTNMLAKVTVTIITACLLPLTLKVVFYFLLKAIG